MGSDNTRHHIMPFGAEIRTNKNVRFRIWAPAMRHIDLCLEQGTNLITVPMTPLDQGWFEVVTEQARAGTRYRFRLENGQDIPDPASRFQPHDIHGPSVVIDPFAYRWKDDSWKGRSWNEAVIYELHIGSFTPEGTFRGALSRLDHLVDIGVTALELMPIADFPGARNWGYDGVLPFAPDSRYGPPEDLKALIDAAHSRNLMVFLDVVYNHFGPEGNYLHLYAPQFFTERHHTPWGAAINFDDAFSRVVRDFFIHNALYWLEEYHFDGLRLDAVHAIADDSDPNILVELANSVTQGPGRNRHIHLVLENEENEARYYREETFSGRRGYRAQWNDDMHHALHVLVTDEHEGYYSDYAETPIRHLARCLTEGFAYQGESSPYRQDAPRGTSTQGVTLNSFVNFLQNHDQVGNRAFGERLSILGAPEAIRAATIVLLLAPSPPLLFMGQEWGTRRPFPFFCDFESDLARAVTDGRRREFKKFSAFQDEAARSRIPDPCDPRTFASAVLDWSECDVSEYRCWLDLHRELLALRQRVIVPLINDFPVIQTSFDLLNERALSVHWMFDNATRLTLVANFGPELSHSMPFLDHSLLYSSHDRPQPDILPSRYVAWFLEQNMPEQHA